MQEESIIVVKMISHQFLNIRYMEYVHLTATPKNTDLKHIWNLNLLFGRHILLIDICESSSVFSSKYMYY